MVTEVNQPPLVATSILATCLYNSGDIWQMHLLDADELGRYADRRGVSFHHDGVTRLWQIGLLRADLVASTQSLSPGDFVQVGKDEQDRVWYLDARRPVDRPSGWVDTAKGLESLPTGIALYFHPFRYYVLWKLSQILEFSLSNLQALVNADGFLDILRFRQAAFQRATSSSEFLERIALDHDIVGLAVMTEPCFYQRVFGHSKVPSDTDPASQEQRIANHWTCVAPLYQQAGLDRIEAVRKEICIAADRLDPNRDVYTMLRLGDGHARLKLEGKLGGAILLRSMAELLRRAAEMSFETELPEEDKLGFGWMPPDVKRQLYGANRLLDDKPAASQFLRQSRLDYAPRVRWYVEGDTEYGALESFWKQHPSVQIDLVNLRGQVVQRNHLAFRDSLRADIRSQVFSFVLLDGDQFDSLNVVRAAAKADEICGGFFLSRPDFEFANFSLTDLEGILWEIAVEERAEESERDKLKQATANCANGKNLITRASRSLSALRNVGKGPKWGECLMDFALRAPDRENGERRPVLEAITLVFQATYCNYPRSRSDYRVDPSTGLPVKR